MISDESAGYFHRRLAPAPEPLSNVTRWSPVLNSHHRRTSLGTPALVAVFLHLLKQLLAVLIILQILVHTLLHSPFAGLNELGLSGHAFAKSGRRFAGVQTGAQEDAVGDTAGKSRLALIAGHGLINTPLVVRLAPEIFTFRGHLLETPHDRIFVAAPPENTGAYDPNYQQHDHDCDDQQNFQPTRHDYLRSIRRE